MPYAIEFPERGNIVEFCLRGVVTPQDIARLNDGLYLSPDWRKGMNCLGLVEKGSNLSAITPEVMQSDLRREAERLRHVRGPDFKVAWVAEDAFHLPVLRLWQAQPFVASAYEIRVFTDTGEARRWLEQFSLAA